MKLTISSAFLILFTIVLSGCFSDAPRDNPFDPQNPKSGIELSGTVFTFYAPHQGIGNARVLLLPGNIVTVTNSNGQFRFNDLKSGAYTLISTADGFATDSLTMQLNVSTSQAIFLNALPYFKQIRLTTRHISRWFPPPQDIFSLQFEVTADDNDGTGDIEKIWFIIDGINYSDTLQQVSPGSDTFKGSISEFDLPVNTLHELIGKPFLFFMKDIPGTTVTSEKQFLTRIIDETPVVTSPVGLATIGSFPITFRWNRVTSLLFPFTYSIEIFSINLGLIVDKIENVPADSGTLNYNGPLDNGDYFWVVDIVDELGNISSSKEGSFRVQQ